MHPTRLFLTLLVVVLVGCSDADLTGPEDPSFGTHGSGVAISSASNPVVPPGFGEGLIATFDSPPEGITMDLAGNLYVGLRFTGEIWKLTPDPTGGEATQSLFATLDAGVHGLLGLAADSRGDIYAAVASFNPATHGVWQISPDGTASRLPGTEQIFFPNAFTFGPEGTLYVTSSSGAPTGVGTYADGQIWAIPPGGSAQLWLEDPLLTGTGALGNGFGIGANGIAYGSGELIVANTELFSVVTVPVENDGSAGIPVVLRDGFGFTDGLKLDANGDIIMVTPLQISVVRLSRDGSTVTHLAGPEDGVDYALSLVFGTGRGDRTSVFLTNFATFPFPFPDRPGFSVLKLDVGVPGAPAH